MRTLELTDEQMNNLNVFLNRTNLKGSEVPQFVELAQIINKPVLDMVSREEIGLKNNDNSKKSDKVKNNN